MDDYKFEPLDYMDAFRVRLPDDLKMEVKELTQNLFGRKESYPSYVRFLLSLRDWLVRPFGLKTASDMGKIQLEGDWIGFFQIFRSSQDEIIIGADDKHLDVRVSCLRTIRYHQVDPRFLESM